MPEIRALPPKLVSVIPDLAASSHFEAIEELGDTLISELSPEFASRLTAMVLARESLASTHLGHETALPHARLPDTAPFCFSFGLSRAGFGWGASAAPTRLVFLSIVPSSQATDYLNFVRMLAMALRVPEKRKKLLESKDKAGAEAWLRQHLALA